MFSPTVENVLSIQKKRSQREEQIRLKVLNTLKEKIQNYANFGHLSCIYNIPNFIIGYTLYNLTEMTKFIIKKLKSEGFCIKQLTSQHIFISWDIKDITNNLNKKSKSNSKSINEDTTTDYAAFINNNKGYK